MNEPYDKPILLQRINEDTEEWTDLYPLHARINKTSKDSEYANAGSERSKRRLTFEVRYFSALEDISYNTQLYRIIYKDRPFNIVDYDDFKERHKFVKLLGESY